MAFDFKKEYKEYYMPGQKPSIVTIPPMNYLAVRGKGNPNIEDGEYKKSIELLYGISYTLKMSYRGSYKIDGFYEYVVPPLEGLWWQKGIDGIDYSRKEDLSFISMIRLPDFIKEEDFNWAVKEAEKKKKIDFSKVFLFKYNEGLSVQIMHIGSYDNEPESIEIMQKYLSQHSYEEDITSERMHHEIYLSDPRKCAQDKLKTVIRHPIRRK